MSAKPNGGPAFPLATGFDVQQYGMSLRDWFAATAVFGSAEAIAKSASCGGSIKVPCALLAETAYVIADAMLAERAK